MLWLHYLRGSFAYFLNVDTEGDSHIILGPLGLGLLKTNKHLFQ